MKRSDEERGLFTVFEVTTGNVVGITDSVLVFRCKYFSSCVSFTEHGTTFTRFQISSLNENVSVI